MAKAKEPTDDHLRQKRRALRAELAEVNNELAKRTPPVPPGTPVRIGGSFAPPLDAAKVKAYRKLAERAGPAVKDAMLSLCDMVETFQETPRSTLRGSPHPSGRGVIVPLEPDEIKRIDSVVPWEHECNAIQELFEALPTGVRSLAFANAEGKMYEVQFPADKELRDAAFHLLWFARELTRDREPITNDML